MGYTRAPKPIYRKVTLDEFGDILTADDMAKFFHIGKPAVNSMCRDGRLPGAFKIGARKWGCSKERIKQYINVA